MEFKRKSYASMAVTKNMTLGQVIEAEVAGAVYDYHGAIETVDAKLQKLIEIVGRIADTLTEEQQASIAKAFYAVESEEPV